jgi:hypothetical protein
MQANDELREPAPPREIDWQRVLLDGEEQARDLIRAHPVATLVGAAALGFALARLVRETR